MNITAVELLATLILFLSEISLSVTHFLKASNNFNALQPVASSFNNKSA